MAIKIDFLSNTRTVERDVDRVADAFSKVSSSLDDVAHDAQRSGDKTSDAFSDLATDGKQSADRLEKSFKQAADETASATQKATRLSAEDYRQMTADIEAQTDRIKRSNREAADSTSEAFRTTKEEAVQNASETFSSFDGSTQSFLDGIQGTFGGVIADLGPLGAAVGAAGAIGIGLFGQKMQQAQEDAEALKQRIADLKADLIENNAETASNDFLKQQIETIVTDQNKLNDAKRKASQLGVSLSTVVRAEAGDTKALTRELAAAKDAYDEKQKAAEQIGSDQATKDAALAAGDHVRAIEAEIQATHDAVAAKDAYNDATGRQSAAEQAAAKASKEAAKEAAEASKQASEDAKAAADDYASGVQSAYAAAGSDIESYVENGKFNLEKYTTAAQANLDAITNYQANMSNLQVTLAQQGHDGALQYLEELGPDAAPLIDAFVKAPAAKQAQLEAIWDQLGAASSSSFGNRLQSDIDARPITQRVDLIVDPSVVQRVLDNQNYVARASLQVNGVARSNVKVVQ